MNFISDVFIRLLSQTGKEFTFIDTYKDLVITVFVIFSLLTTFIIVLVFYLRRISRMKQKLYEGHLELTQLYDELAASEGELRKQFVELNYMQKSLVDSEERYELLFEKMLNGFCVFEPIYSSQNWLIDLLFITMNSSFEYHTHKTASEIIGKTWSEVFGIQDMDLNRFEKVLKSGVAERFELYHREENIYYLVNAFRIQSNRVGVVIDNITDYKKAIEEVEKLNEELELRVLERTNKLQDVIEELESFSYTVSHDLKAPLRAVDGYSKIILEDYGTELNDEIVEMLSMIRGVSSEMIDMIHKLLQYSTTTTAELQTEKISSYELVQAVFKELMSSYSHRKIELRIETELPVILGDRVLLKQVICNLLSNAMKFTNVRDVAIISVGVFIADNEYIFYIKDNGVGFNMSYSQKLFTIFQRLHTSEEFEGSGIGLVTVKKIVEKHGGRTWIEGKLNEGTTIFFTLPILCSKG